MRALILTIICFTLPYISYAEISPKFIVENFGKEMSLWCQTNDISHRENIEALCNGVKKCRVEDKIHADYQSMKGLTDYNTFVLDSYLNMFQSLMDNNIHFFLSDITIVKEDSIENLFFLKARIRVSGALNKEVDDLFLVRDGKISGIYMGKSGLSIKHLNGSLLRALETGRYIDVSGFIDGYCVVKNEANHEGLIDVDGNVIIPCIWEGIDYVGGDFAKGYNLTRMQGCVYDLRFGGKVTPLDNVQHYLVNRDEPVSFQDGMATVFTPNRKKFGYLREEDLTYSDIKYNYDLANRFSDGLATVKIGEEAHIIDKNFNIIRTFKDGDRFGIAGSYHEGLCPISDFYYKDNLDGQILYGFIDKKGKIAIPCEYLEVDRFSEGICFVKTLNGLWGAIDKSGNMVMKAQFDGKYINQFFKDGYINVSKIVKQNGEFVKKESLVGRNGKPIQGFDWRFDEVGRFYNDRAQFVNDDKYGFLDRKGKIVIPNIYDYASVFTEGYVVVAKEINGKYVWGCLDENGTCVIPFEYDDLTDIHNGFSLARKDGKVGFVDVYGNSYFFK